MAYWYLDGNVLYALLADGVMLLHASFILFVVAGGLLVFWRRGLAFVHIPCVAWGILSSIYGWLCPLTDLENYWRSAAGSRGYEGGYIENYLLPLIYPPGLTPDVQLIMGVSLLAVNILIYFWAWRYWRDRA